MVICHCSKVTESRTFLNSGMYRSTRNEYSTYSGLLPYSPLLLVVVIDQFRKGGKTNRYGKEAKRTTTPSDLFFFSYCRRNMLSLCCGFYGNGRLTCKDKTHTCILWTQYPLKFLHVLSLSFCEHTYLLSLSIR